MEHLYIFNIIIFIFLNKCVKTSKILRITANNASPVILVHGGAGTISTDTYQDKVRNKPKMAYSRDLADMDYH